MPIYEYQCKNCHRVFEEWLKEFDVNAMPCPHCQGNGERMISIPTFILKGGGWYATEYSNRGGQENHTSEQDGEVSIGGYTEVPPPSKKSEDSFAGVLEKQERPPQNATPTNSTATNK